MVDDHQPAAEGVRRRHARDNSAWDSGFAGVIALAASKGGIVGFQAAGPKLLSTCNRVAYSVDDAMSTYQPLFYEAAPSQISDCSGFLLGDPGNLQARLLAVWGR